MTFVQFVNFLHDHGLDVIILGFLNNLLNALLKRLFKKLNKELPKKYLTAIPFASGLLLYLLWIPLASTADFTASVAVIAERGLGVGLTSTLCHTFSAFFTKKPKDLNKTTEEKREENETSCKAENAAEAPLDSSDGSA